MNLARERVKKSIFFPINLSKYTADYFATFQRMEKYICTYYFEIATFLMRMQVAKYPMSSCSVRIAFSLAF